MGIKTIISNALNTASSFFASMWNSVTNFLTKVYKKVSGQQARTVATGPISVVDTNDAATKSLRMLKANIELQRSARELGAIAQQIKVDAETKPLRMLTAKFELWKATRELSAAVKERREEKVAFKAERKATLETMVKQWLYMKP